MNNIHIRSAMKKDNKKNYILHILLPCLVYGSAGGILTGAVIFGFRVMTDWLNKIAVVLYDAVCADLWLLPLFFLALAALAFLLSVILKWAPSANGGGIPTAMGILRGIVTFKWLRTFVGVIASSVITFFAGMPLCNDGPSVLIGASLGRGVNSLLGGKKGAAWDRYVMTGCAGAGFAAATMSPLTAVFIALEEIHKKFSPMLLMTVFSSVLSATATTRLWGELFKVDTAFFHFGEMPSLGLSDIWLPVVLGCAVSLFAALFLLLARSINHLFINKLKRIPHFLQLTLVFVLCGAAGLWARDFIGGGHELIVHINARSVVPLALLLIFCLKFFLVPVANVSGATGGLFIPTLALGALIGALLAELFIAWGVNPDYYKIIVVLSISGFMSAASRVPLSAIMLALEAMNGTGNILFIAVSVSVSFMLLELTKLPAINDIVLETTIKISTHERQPKNVEISLEVKPDAFVAGKTVRDVLWPANTIILSVTRAEHTESENGERLTKDGEKELKAGDILRLRFQTYDEETTVSGLLALLGEQNLET